MSPIVFGRIISNLNAFIVATTNRQHKGCAQTETEHVLWLSSKIE